MVNGSVVNASDGLLDLIVGVGNIGRWIQAIGLVVIIWIVFQLILLWFNNKRLKEVYKIKEDVKRIEGKIDKLLIKK